MGGGGGGVAVGAASAPTQVFSLLFDSVIKLSGCKCDNEMQIIQRTISVITCLMYNVCLSPSLSLRATIKPRNYDQVLSLRSDNSVQEGPTSLNT